MSLLDSNSHLTEALTDSEEGTFPWKPLDEIIWIAFVDHYLDEGAKDIIRDQFRQRT